MDLIQKAKNFAHAAHDSIGQKRKYTGDPYWVHVDEVADIVIKYGASEAQIAAAFLHDTVEDVNKFPFDLDGIQTIFGTLVAGYVWDLTDRFTHEDYPRLNRDQRKESEAIRITGINNASKTIKLADLYSNSRDIVSNDPDFAKVYLREKERMLPGLVGGNPVLWDVVKKQLIEGLKSLDMSPKI